MPMWFIGAVQAIRAHRRAMKQGGEDIEAIMKQIQALREELHALRDTSTEHHLSLQERVRMLEDSEKTWRSYSRATTLTTPFP